MLANDMKKGTEVIQHNGWYAKIMDNKKGIIRLAEVHGFFTEIGSIYIDDIDMKYHWLIINSLLKKFGLDDWIRKTPSITVVDKNQKSLLEFV